MMLRSHTAGDERNAWFIRPVILFAAAYIIILLIHESTHALAAYALDVPFTLYPFGVDVDREGATLIEQAAIGVAGPLCALLIGLICWFFYRRARGLRSELMLLFLATFGGGTFFGNLMSVAFVGDFSRAALSLRLPMPARYAASLVGLISLCGWHFMVGWELRRLSPSGSGRMRGMIVMVILPVVAGTALVTLSSLPMPSNLLFARLAETSFWIFGVAGLLMSRKTPSGGVRTLHLGWVDVATLAAMVIVVRFMAVGVHYQP